jgi:hypothetical protein
MSKTYKNNKSGVTGVHYKTRDARWFASISVNGEKIELGRFRDREEAIQARFEAEQFYKNRFQEQTGFQLIHFLLQVKLNIEPHDFNINYEKEYNNLVPYLLYCASAYNGETSFSRYAIENMLNLYKKQIKLEITDLNLIEINNCDYYLEWLNGVSVNKLAKKYNISVTTMNSMIHKINNKIIIKKC